MIVPNHFPRDEVRHDEANHLPEDPAESLQDMTSGDDERYRVNDKDRHEFSVKCVCHRIEPPPQDEHPPERRVLRVVVFGAA